MPRQWMILIALVTWGCFKGSKEGESTNLDHHLFDSLLVKHVDSLGLVNYKGFEKDSLLLNQYLKEVEQNLPSKEWPEMDRLAYWINAYNAFTIKLILEKKPKSSIKDITTVNIPMISSPWQIDFINLGAEVYNLDDIEHGIIREEFNEPRIHFALVCAARSCPPLRNEAYIGTKLHEQLTEQTRRFLADRSKNEISTDYIRLSKIFDWYEKDFKSEDRSLIPFLNQYTDIQISEDAKIEYMNYDWTLNRQ